MKPILTLKNYSTLYFDRNECCWDLNKPDGALGEDYLIKRTGCKLNVYYSSEYFNILAKKVTNEKISNRGKRIHR